MTLVDEALEMFETSQREQAKNVAKIRKILSSELSRLVKAIEKVEKGANTLSELEESVTKGSTKKMWASQIRAIKALEEFSKYILTSLEEWEDPDPNKEMTYDELTAFLRRFVPFVNNIDEQRQKTDKIMGLDFIMKKRAITSPFGDVRKARNKIRDLRGEEYQLIKTLEDMDRILNEMQSLADHRQTKEYEVEQLEEQINRNQTEENSLRKKIEDLQQQPIVKEAREHRIRLKQIEIDLGRHLNPLRKPFRKFLNQAERGTISVSSFMVTTTARQYESSPVEHFLKEEDGFPLLSSLLDDMIPLVDQLHLKGSERSRLTQERNNLAGKKVTKAKAEYLEISSRLDELMKSSELVKSLEQMDQLENKLEKLQEEKEQQNELLRITKKDIDKTQENLEFRYNQIQEMSSSLSNPKK